MNFLQKLFKKQSIDLSIEEPLKLIDDGRTGQQKGDAVCSVCGRASAEYLRDLKRRDPTMRLLDDKFIGICPTCHKAFCVEHAGYDREIDHEVCPVHRMKLSLLY